MSSPPPPRNRLVTLLRSVMGNAAWDGIKNIARLAYENWPLLVLAMGAIASGITAAINRLRGMPSDFLGVLAVFAVTVVIAFISHIIGRMRDKKRPTARPNGGNSQTSESVDLQIQDSLHGCPDERLHRWAGNDRLSAWRLVKFISASCELNIAPDGPPPFIVFRFGVFSLTLREVAIRDEVGGAIYFKVPEQKPWKLRRTIEMEDNEAKQVLFRGHYLFKVRQDLTREDADYIRDHMETGFFQMDDLVSRISGDGLDDPRLDTRFSVSATENYQPSLTDFLFPTAG